jgi:hypothetical protein
MASEVLRSADLAGALTVRLFLVAMLVTFALIGAVYALGAPGTVVAWMMAMFLVPVFSFFEYRRGRVVLHEGGVDIRNPFRSTIQVPAAEVSRVEPTEMLYSIAPYWHHIGIAVFVTRTGRHRAVFTGGTNDRRRDQNHRALIEWCSHHGIPCDVGPQQLGVYTSSVC